MDYSKWLGKGYETTPVERCGLYVSNHVGFLDTDVVAVASINQIGYVIAEWVKNIPFYGSMAQQAESLFLPRGDPEKTQGSIDKITERTAAIEQGRSNKRPVVIFPAGFCTNGTHTVRYKKGAFMGLNSVRPMILKYQSSHFMPNNAGIGELSMMTFLWCSFSPVVCEVTFLPVFTPNECLFSNMKPGQEKWEVYAQAVREVMSEFSGMPMNEHTYQDLKDYWALAGCKKAGHA